jgi:hypothetical protein
MNHCRGARPFNVARPSKAVVDTCKMSVSRQSMAFICRKRFGRAGLAEQKCVSPPNECAEDVQWRLATATVAAGCPQARIRAIGEARATVRPAHRPSARHGMRQELLGPAEVRAVENKPHRRMVRDDLTADETTARLSTIESRNRASSTQIGTSRVSNDAPKGSCSRPALAWAKPHGRRKAPAMRMPLNSPSASGKRASSRCVVPKIEKPLRLDALQLDRSPQGVDGLQPCVALRYSKSIREASKSQA